MESKLQKAINLSKKTGDRIIVFDQNNPNQSFVVMDLNEYEKIIIGKSEVRGLTEEELLDKINRDIAIWKSDNQECFANNNFKKYNNCYIKEEDEFNVKNSDCEDFEGEDEDEEMYYYNEEKEEGFFNSKELKESKETKNDYYNNFDFPDDSEEKNEEEKNEGLKNNWRISKKIKKEAINF